MAGIYSILGLQDTDRSFVNTIGQRTVFDAAQQFLTMSTDDMMNAFSVFVEAETDGYKERYKLPGGGRLQRRGGVAASGAVKAGGSWDVAYPLEDFGDQIANDDVSLAYMTLPELQRHLDTIVIRDINTMRYEMLRALLNSSARTFIDPLYGSLTVQPAANGDSVLYPPVLGTETEATENHYLESGYLSAAISNTNNPYITLRNELEEHFGTPTGFGNIAVFINSAQVPITETLTDYDSVADINLAIGANSDVPTNLPAVPGRVVGRCEGVWVVEWRWIPANYMVAVDLDAPAPLKVRVDPADTGLGTGLQLVSSSDAQPLQNSHYRHRFGVGVGNRLNAVVLELGNGGTYTVPTGF